MRKIYLSGPMTGIEQFNYPLFNSVAAQLRANGDLVYNPAEYCKLVGVEPNHIDLRAAFAEYCNYICRTADTIVMLPGWILSQGARAEFALALNFPIEVFYWENIAADFSGLPPYRELRTS